MIERLREGWQHFASGRPGLRFRERYRLHQSRARRKGRGRLALTRLYNVGGGSVLIALSALFGWLPVLGWGTAILGLGMIAAEFYFVARLMDRLEVRARALFKPLGRAFARWPAWAQLSVSLTIAASTFALVYGAFSLSAGS